MTPNRLGSDLTARWSRAIGPVLVAALTASVAWLISHRLLGHQLPIFAAIAAIVCLSPGVSSRGQQALGMMGGVTVGIVVGELLLPAAVLPAALRVGIVAVVAMMAAATFGLRAVMIIQAGASAIIVLATTQLGTGVQRVTDALIGGALGLLVSQVLLTPDPVRAIQKPAVELFAALAWGLREAADALVRVDAALARSALDRLAGARAQLVALEAGIGTAQALVRWTVRGRLAARQVATAADRHDHRVIRAWAAALLFGESLVTAFGEGEGAGEPPAGLADAAGRTAAACARLGGETEAKGGDGDVGPPDPSTLPPAWRRCADGLEVLAEALRALEGDGAAAERGGR